MSGSRTIVGKGWLIEDEPWFRLTDLGLESLASFGMERVPGRTCMDWSERRLHLAGPLGAHLARALIDRKLLLRDRKSRALRVSPQGTETLKSIFGVSNE